MTKEYLQVIFNIGEIEYKTFRSLPNSTALLYISKFKKQFTLDDFDLFVSSNDPYIYQQNHKPIIRKDILKIYGIEVPDKIYNQHTKDRVKLYREEDVQFNRDLKLKLLQV